MYHQKHVYYQELEEFKHDYKNILFSLDYLLESNQVTEAKQIFSQLKNYSKKILDNSVMEIDNIKVEAFKGLLLDFYGNAKTNNVPVSIIVTNNIESLPMDTFSFLRMLSILLTNALEHNQPNNQPIEIEITSNSNQFCFCISNSTTLNHLNLEHLFQRTYSQKKTGGLGLYILNKEINSNANIDYNIELEKAETNRFIFTLTILYP